MKDLINKYTIPDDPYEIIKDSSVLHEFESILGIRDAKIFVSVLKGNEITDKAVSMLTGHLSGAFNLGGVLGWMKLKALHYDSRTFLKNQLTRLKCNPDSFQNEFALNLIVFACMGYEMETWLQHSKAFSDVPIIGMGLFSSKKRQEWMERVISREIECVRWIYSSSILMIIHYIALSNRYGYSYDLNKLKKICEYLVTLYCSCDEPLECFIVDYKKLLLGDENYIHDILLKDITPKILSHGILLSSEDEKIISNYCCDSNKDNVLSDIEKRTKKP